MPHPKIIEANIPRGLSKGWFAREVAKVYFDLTPEACIEIFTSSGDWHTSTSFTKEQALDYYKYARGKVATINTLKSIRDAVRGQMDTLQRKIEQLEKEER